MNQDLKYSDFVFILIIFQDSDDIYVPYKASEVGIRLGDVTLKTAKEGKLYGAKKIYVHPEFDNVTLHNDIAVIVLSEKLKVGPKINPVCLPPPSTEADVSCSKVASEN